MSVRFTVVTVVYNSAATIRKTIESVLAQEYAPYEYLVIDGLSQDGTVSVAKEYEAAFQAHGVHYNIISEQDTGIYNAMNKGVRLATGDFISFLNAGDWYETDALKNIATFYAEESFDLTYGGLHYVKPDGSVINKMSRLDRCPISSRNWNHPSMFLRTEIYRRYGFDERYKAYADFHLYLRLRKDGTKIRVINKVITNFVADGVSTNTNLKRVLARAKEKYTAYTANGFSPLYWIESYGWEVLKCLYLGLKK